MTQSYWWFQGQSVQKIKDQLNEAGPDAILKVIPVGQDKLLLSVVDPEGHGKDPVNDSHICPPQCP